MLQTSAQIFRDKVHPRSSNFFHICKTDYHIICQYSILCCIRSTWPTNTSFPTWNKYQGHCRYTRICWRKRRSLAGRETTRCVNLIDLILGYVRLRGPTAQPQPKTMTKEWQEASNERARDQKMNPISGKQTSTMNNLEK